MDEIVVELEDLASENSTKHEICLKTDKLTLELVPKLICRYCKSFNAINLEVKASIEHSCELKHGLQRALFNECRSDFCFIIDNERIHVNKNILAIRSPVFERMFSADFEEKKQNQQIIQPPFQKPAFKELIRYLYTGEVCDLSSYVFDLLHASDYYQVDGLKALCEKKLDEILCEDNAHMIFQYAHDFQCKSGLVAKAFMHIDNIFQKNGINLPHELSTNPSKVAKLFERKEELEEEFECDNSKLISLIGFSIFIVFAFFSFNQKKSPVEIVIENINPKRILKDYFTLSKQY